MFSPETDPALIAFENTISNTNPMYAMRTIGLNICDQTVWDGWLENGKQALVENNVPRCLVAGEYDGVFNLTSTQQLKEQFDIPDQLHHVIAGVGHLPMLEKGEEVSMLLQNFLSSLGVP